MSFTGLSSEQKCPLIKLSHLVIVCQLNKIHNPTCFSWQRYIYKDRKPEHMFNNLLAWFGFWASTDVLSPANVRTGLHLVTITHRRSCVAFYYLTLWWVKWSCISRLNPRGLQERRAVLKKSSNSCQTETVPMKKTLSKKANKGSQTRQNEKNLLWACLLSKRNINRTSKGWRETTNTGRTKPSVMREEQEKW